MKNENTIFNAFAALFYLIGTIVIQQWKLILFSVLISCLMFAIPFILNQTGGGSMWMISGTVVLIAQLPVLLISLVILPVVHSQIHNSSIQRRLQSSGISNKIYVLTIVLTFSLIALLVFYIFTLLIYLAMPTLTYWSNDIQYTYWAMDVNFTSFFIFVPISIVGFTSTGLLLGQWKLNDIVKGVVVFVIIMFIIISSRLIMNPLDGIYIGEPTSSGEQIIEGANNANLWKILLFNPWGSMQFSTGMSLMNINDLEVNSGTIGQLSNLGLIKDAPFQLWSTQIYSSLWSLLLLIIAVFAIK